MVIRAAAVCFSCFYCRMTSLAFFSFFYTGVLSGIADSNPDFFPFFSLFRKEKPWKVAANREKKRVRPCDVSSFFLGRKKIGETQFHFICDTGNGIRWRASVLNQEKMHPCVWQYETAYPGYIENAGLVLLYLYNESCEIAEDRRRLINVVSAQRMQVHFVPR